jgi:3-hydroxyisobutyrate dehydrogenase-like beta-hydroxyacid dehydrogenase
MRVLIVGCGNMGRAIATRVAIGKHELTLFDLDPAASELLASELGGTRPGGARVAVAETPADGAADSRAWPSA